MERVEAVLSIEELAYAMGVLGGIDTAIGFLLGTLGQRPRLEVEGRLLAAAHSLVARGYLAFDVTTSSSWLTDSLAKLVQPIVRNHHILRLSRTKGGEEDIATLYASNEGMVFQHLQRGVVSRLLFLADAVDARDQCLLFFDLTNGTEAFSEPLGTIAANTIDILRRSASERSLEATAAELASHGLEPTQALRLAEDLRHDMGRGSIVRLESQGEEVVSQRGMLILKGDHRNWLFEISPAEEEVLHVYLGTPAVFDILFMRLTSRI